MPKENMAKNMDTVPRVPTDKTKQKGQNMTNEKRIFLKNFIWNIFGTGLNSFNSLFFLIIVTRINGMNDAGIFSIAYSTALILYTIGLYSGRLCQVTDIEKRVSDKDYVINRLMTCLLMILIAVIFVFAKQYAPYKMGIFLLLCIYKATEAFGEILYGIMQKSELLYKSGQSLTMKSIGGFVLFLVVDWLTHNLIFAILTIILLNIVILVVFDFIFVSKKLIDFTTKLNWKNVWHIFQSEFFVFANSFAGIYVLNAPKYAIDSYLTEDVQAIFGYIMMPATVITLFTQFIFMPYLNKLRELYEQKNMKEFNAIALKIKLAIIAFGVLASIAAYGIGPEVLSIIYGEDLIDYRMNLTIIIVAYILYGISYVNLVLLTTTRNTFVQFVVYLVTMFVALIGSNLLVQKLQINGATISVVVTLGVQFILYTIVTKLIFRKIEKEAIC